ncbi:hypothetical protein B0A69_12515 [Chryseobacterium shigense]|uniref:Uncharacterized protein n=1 Tax=Chryseobacterium shigense TaxID=297244 RepID=A0A1N7JUT6_9FLAO|nr:hypothetical protein [Chryseobacterium shigense]PQA92982.1 hypothetical protein B0A69_12515 [Chryseobacterium shigense]SIS52974.1 hypothetical protein SAMN05421639_107171 [Chryseobacterium shigense]
MTKKLPAFIAVFIFCLSFSQYALKDSIRPKCNGILRDITLSNVEYSFSNRINRPQEPKLIFGCGTAAMEYAEEMSCMNAESILKKYPFIIKELKNRESEILTPLGDSNILWIQNEPDRPTHDPVEIRKNEIKYKNWELKKKRIPVSVSITINRKNNETEDVLIQFLWTDKKKEITKKYKVFKNPEWSYTQS